MSASPRPADDGTRRDTLEVFISPRLMDDAGQLHAVDSFYHAP